MDGPAIDSKNAALFVPADLKKFKQKLFDAIGKSVGYVVRSDPKRLDALPDHVVPIVGCTPELRPWIEKWRRTGKTWIYWDRGYFRRSQHTAWLPRGRELGIEWGFYRWHINGPQMQKIYDVPDDRWKFVKLDQCIKPWNRNGRHIVVIDTMKEYFDLWDDRRWIERTVATLKFFTDRPIEVRHHLSKVPLYDQLRDAHALVSHGSVAAVESVIFGCPVFVDQSSAASLVGRTDFSQIENPVYPERMPWLHSLAYCQYTEAELVDGTLWKLIR
jgi:hypothetical protein